jgi:4-amino-4-deoxy-L-arabinose transferase-like glycosyltransferase
MTVLDGRDTRDVPFVPTVIVALLLLACVSLLILPRSHWELDEFLFRAGVESFEPLRHHPHPPGYPALAGLGKVFALMTGDPFTGMRTLAVISTLVGFAALAAAIAGLSGTRATGIAASALFYFSCAQLVHSTTPMSDPPALMFLFVGLWGWSRGRETKAWPVVVMGVALSMSIGCRPQYAVAIVPGLLVAIAMKRSWRFAVVALGTFTITCLTWMVPLVFATGGIEGFLEYELGQAVYVAAHDAELSRGWMSDRQVLERFLEHPWGGGAMSTAIFALAAVGAVLSVRRRLTWLVPFVVISIAHIAFTLATSDPADAVRYALVFQPLPATLAAVALVEFERAISRRGAALVVAGAFAAMSLVYAWPVVGWRARHDSPPVRAADWLDANVSREAIVLFDNSLRPHAEAMLRGREMMSMEDGFRAFWNRPEKQVWILSNGRTAVSGARTFEWDGTEHAVDPRDLNMDVRRPWAKAYARLTRNHYGVVSVIPHRPGQRFLPGNGVFATEWSPRRPEWRWLAPAAVVTIPPGDGALTVTLHIPRDHPEETVDVGLSSGGAVLAESRVARGESAVLEIPFPAAGGELAIRSGASHVPVEHGARDRRELAIQLIGIERSPGGGGPGYPL